MSATPLHRHYLHFSELPTSMRVMYTAVLLVLGLAYMFAAIYLFHTYSGRDGNPKDLSYDDLVIAYSGSGKGSRLEVGAAWPDVEHAPARRTQRACFMGSAGGRQSEVRNRSQTDDRKALHGLS